jgi:septal ring factor EnvC (AmiA/AmiB activator)
MPTLWRCGPLAFAPERLVDKVPMCASALASCSLAPSRLQSLSTTKQRQHAHTVRERTPLWHEVSSLRKHYERASNKAGSLRTALRTARRCLSERDSQLAVAHRAISRLDAERTHLEVATLSMTFAA